MGFVTADIIVGGFLGSFLGVFFANRVGRKKALYYSSIISIICPLGLAIFPGFYMNVINRTILGIAVGALGCVCPLYVSEMAPVDKRGQLGTIFQISICFFVFLSQVTNYIFNPEASVCIDTWKWQIQFGLATVFGFMLLLISGR